jgi:putative oxygen-independent coproporphyrinogen III oxidase
MDLGLYVHFPWCRARCPYCDFAIAIAPLAEIPHAAYADAVLGELEGRAARFAGRRLVSIYFGGGTPALWNPRQLARLVAAGAAAFGARPETLEITVEANPIDCTADTLAALRRAGANRLSIGTQAFDDGALVALGRDHGAAHARGALPAAREAGFDNVSLDLIYALPGRRVDDWRRTVDEAASLAPDHLSVYELTFEERTPFGRALKRGRMQKRPDDDGAAEFELAHAALVAAGYEHYEVSSYARPGRRAVHNALYWRGAEYLGVGNGACSFWRAAPDRGLRWANHRAVSRYLAAVPDGADALVESTEELDAAALRADALWLGLRTTDGVARADAAGREPIVERLLAAGLLVEEGERLRPTPRGFLLSDLVGVELLE